MLRNLIKNTAIYGLGDFVFKFIGFAVFPIYAHTFSVEEFGAMALVTTLAGLVGIFLNVGMNNSIQRFLLGPRDARGSSPGSGEHWPLAPLGFVNAPYWTRALGFVPSTEWSLKLGNPVGDYIWAYCPRCRGTRILDKGRRSLKS